MPHLETKSGIKWNYLLEGKGEPIFFLHGWGVDLRIWRQQTKHFCTHYQVVAIDLPGHGQSTWKHVSLEEMARDIKELLEQLNIKPMNVVGSSLGGLIALKLFEVAPEVFTRLILVGALPKFLGDDDFPFGWQKSVLDKFGSHLEGDYPQIVNVFFRSLFTVKERESRRFKWLEIFRKNTELPDKRALENYLDILAKEDLRDVVGRVKIPLQLINGKEDQICPPDIMTFFQKEAPHARIDLFEECGHFPFLTKPHQFNKILEEFVNHKPC